MACAVISRLVSGKTDVIMMLNGALGGLVAITAEPLAPSPILAITIGAIGGTLVFYGTILLFKLKIPFFLGKGLTCCLLVGIHDEFREALPKISRNVICGFQIQWR